MMCYVSIVSLSVFCQCSFCALAITVVDGNEAKTRLIRSEKTEALFDDSSTWPASADPPSRSGAHARCEDNVLGQNFCTEWCNHKQEQNDKWSCGVATYKGQYTCHCQDCNGCDPHARNDDSYGDAVLQVPARGFESNRLPDGSPNGPRNASPNGPLSGQPQQQAQSPNKASLSKASLSNDLDSPTSKMMGHKSPVKSSIQREKNQTNSSGPSASAVSSSINAGTKELEYELQNPDGGGKKSKVALAMVGQFIILGFLGCDRCFMGQSMLGLLKFITGGGFAIWAIIDYAVICINMMTSATAINSMGFNAKFEDKSDIADAWWVSLFFVPISVAVVAGTILKYKDSVMEWWYGKDNGAAEESPAEKPADGVPPVAAEPADSAK